MSKLKTDRMSEQVKPEDPYDSRQCLEDFLTTRSAESFSDLFKILYPQVLKYFLTRSLDRMAAEELSQNVLFAVYDRIDDLREKHAFSWSVFRKVGRCVRFLPPHTLKERKHW